MRVPRSLARWSLLALVALASGACGSEPPPTPRLVVLYTACTVNKGLLSPYGPKEQHTPRLAELARDGLVFEQHRTEAGTSGIAFAAIFSGSHADVHGVYRQPTPLADELWLISEAFAEAGWDTFYWSGHRMATPDLNYAQGARVVYEHEFEDLPAYTATDPAFEAILERLAREPDYRAFVQVNVVMAHSPYATYLPPGCLETYLAALGDDAPRIDPGDRAWARASYAQHRLALQWDYHNTVRELGWTAAQEATLASVLELDYRAGLHHLDRWFGKLCDAVDSAGLEGDSLIAFTADHGETLVRPEHPFRWSHTLQIAPEVLDVPWIVRCSKLGLQGRFPEVTRSIDVFPTLAGWCGVGLRASAPIQGRDLGPAVASGNVPGASVPAAFAHTALLRPTRIAKLAGFPHVANGPSLEDPAGMAVSARTREREIALSNPTGERWIRSLNGREVNGAEAADEFEELMRYKERLVAAWPGRSGAGQADDAMSAAEAAERLRELGYVDGD